MTNLPSSQSHFPLLTGSGGSIPRREITQKPIIVFFLRRRRAVIEVQSVALRVVHKLSFISAFQLRVTISPEFPQQILPFRPRHDLRQLPNLLRLSPPPRLPNSDAFAADQRPAGPLAGAEAEQPETSAPGRRSRLFLVVDPCIR